MAGGGHITAPMYSRKLLVGLGLFQVLCIALVHIVGNNRTRVALEEVKPVRQSLMAVPLTTNSDVLDAFEDGDEDQTPLPKWATDWGQTKEYRCKKGTQCINGNPNPLGELGLWVMKKTEPAYNPAYTGPRQKSCLGLPGWAYRRCLKTREREAGLSRTGAKKPPPLEDPA
eukprot:CAMPEP_0113663166 /NCGR_PEP_ID=MMETSP0038_2-20120614/986_1 /TAXON_ID=2898 /ORGANISM="Cryptomonas paramecium" /LENGTH=170 /DNA_ID=CAMNT_0000578153 /DNA_START=12 /DNA_END=520 /DNA_ORIENTATION=- /assembly_acc=CAM_ASM_000170